MDSLAYHHRPAGPGIKEKIEQGCLTRLVEIMAEQRREKEVQENTKSEK